MNRARALVGVLLFIGTIQQAFADFIPLHDGFYQYLEVVNTYSDTPSGQTGAWFYGYDPLLAETVTGSAGPASGYAKTTAGRGTIAPIAESRSQSRAFILNGEDYYYQVVSDASIEYDLQLIKLHPDAPDDVIIPLRYTSMMTGGSTGRLKIEDLNTSTELVYEVYSGVGYEPYIIDSSISAVLGHTLRTWIYSGQLTASESSVPSAQVTGPVFQIDPNFMVPFLNNADGTIRYEHAVNLYSLAYPASIGYAGDFNTVTPFIDGCLPDPSILGSDGNPSVTGGETVTCQAIDPSGFRSYGPGIQDPMGDLDDMVVTITQDAIVTTDADQTETIGILGNNNDIYNVEGTIEANGDESVAIFLGNGNGNTVSNYGNIISRGVGSHAVQILGDEGLVYNTSVIATTNNHSAAVYLEGNGSGIINEGQVITNGIRSAAIVIEGDDGELLNDGIVQTTADQSAGLAYEGFIGLIDNDGEIGTQGVFSAGIASLGISSIHNTGQITTNSADAMGILALGPGHEIVNDGSGASNQIYTLGARAHGIALGLQEAVIPPDVEIPIELLNPAAGTITSSGPITTEGNEADAIHAFADDLELTNTGELTTFGADAFGISVDGSNAVVKLGDGAETGTITTRGLRANGIDVIGRNPTVIIDGGPTAATILVQGDDANGVDVIGFNAQVISTGMITVEGDESDGIDVFGDEATVENSGTIIVGTGLGSSSNSGLEVTSSDGRTKNLGTIQVLSDNSYGILALENGLAVTNGDTSNRGARIEVTGAGGIGVYAESDAPAIVNEGIITVRGDEATGIHAVTGVGSVSEVTSAGTINVSGTSAVGMRLAPNPVWATDTAGGFSPACAIVNDGTSKFINCGSIDFPNSDFGEGMFAENVANTTIENQNRIEGGGLSTRGIRVTSDLPSTLGERNNLVANVDSVIVTGENAVGIDVSGENNLILNGNGTIALPNDPFGNIKELTDPIGFTLHPNAQQFANEFTRDVPGGTILPISQVKVAGPNAVGVSIAGTGNRAGQVFSAQADNTLIEARGSNAIGVKLSGTGNLFVNAGEIDADGIGIQGGSGADSVTNQNIVVGGIDLAEGPDRLVLDTPSVIQGTVDGGTGTDELIFFVGGDLSTGPFEKVVDGDQFVNFEKGAKIGAGNLRVLDQLVLDMFTIYSGDTRVSGPARIITASNSIHIKEGGSLSGSGTAVGRVSIEGGALFPGDSIGNMNIDGDLVLESGLLEFEFSTDASDSLTINGDVFLNGGNIEVLLDYMPDQGDVLQLALYATALQIGAGFDGIFGTAAAGSNIAIGTQFLVSLGDEIFNATVTSAVPLPPSVYLLASALIMLIMIGRRRKNCGHAR